MNTPYSLTRFENHIKKLNDMFASGKQVKLRKCPACDKYNAVVGRSAQCDFCGNKFGVR